MKKLAKKITKKVSKKVTKKKAVQRKVTKKSIKKKVTKRNPLDYKLPVFESEKGKYIKLSDFEFQFIRELSSIVGGHNYYQHDYEIDNILKWGLGNSNLVSSGVKNLISLKLFKDIMSVGLPKAFSNPKNEIKAYHNTLDRIPDDVKLIDTGN